MMSEEDSHRMELFHAELSNVIKRLSQLESHGGNSSLIKLTFEKRLEVVEKKVAILMEDLKERATP